MPKTPSPNVKKSPRTGPHPVSERSQPSTSASRAPEHQPVASVPLTPLIPLPRYEGPAKLIYLFGRHFSPKDMSFSPMHSVEYFDPRTKTWGSAGSIPFVRCGYAVASFRDKIWIAGGWKDGYSSLVNIFDPVTNAWAVGPQMLTGRSGLGLIEYNGKLHAIGGATGKSPENVIDYTASTEILASPKSQTWTIGASMKFARVEMGVALLRQRIYVLGGEQHCEAADRGRMEYFCSVTGKWTEITNIRPNLDDYKKLIAYDEFLYVFGEEDEKSNSVAKYCYAYNSIESGDQAWQPQRGSNGTCIRPESVVVQVDGNVYFIGGLYDQIKTDNISKYDIENQEWDERWWSRELARIDAKAVVVNDHRQREPATPKTPSPNFKKSPRTGPYPVSERSQSSTSASRAPEQQPVASAPLTPLIPLPQYEDFLNFDLDRARETIRRNDLNASGEEIYRYVIGWIEKDESRHQHLLDLLLEVRLIYLSYDFLNNVVELHQLVQNNIKYLSVVAAAKAYRCVFLDERAKITEKREYRRKWLSQASAELVSNWEQVDIRVFDSDFCVRRRSIRPAKLIYLFGRHFSPKDWSFSAIHSVEYFDPRTKTWGSAGSMPFVRYGYAVASFRDKIWIAGGCNALGFSSLVNIFDPVTNAWAVGPQMLTGRSELGLIEYNGKLHAIGGAIKKSPENDIYCAASTEILDPPESLTWTIGASMNSARSGMGVALLRQRIYVLGGEQHHGAADCCRMEYFCSVNGMWTEITNVRPNLDEYNKLIAYDEFLYVFGEKNYETSNSAAKHCYAYNSLETDDQAWQHQRGSYGPCIRPESVVVQVDGNVYFIGGLYHHMKTADISKYDIENHEWDEQWWSCELARIDAKAVVVNDHRQ